MKTVYLQYSTRQEIVNSTRSVEQGGNVLLVSLENLLVGAQLPSAPALTRTCRLFYLHAFTDSSRGDELFPDLNYDSILLFSMKSSTFYGLR